MRGSTGRYACSPCRTRRAPSGLHAPISACIAPRQGITTSTHQGRATTMQTSFDALIIGSGQAGPFLAVPLAAAGLKVALVEREHLGGTCVNDGCMPTKTLVASARVAHLARRAGDYGVSVGPSVTVDMRAVKARKDLVVRN